MSYHAVYAASFIIYLILTVICRTVSKSVHCPFVMALPLESICLLIIINNKNKTCFGNPRLRTVVETRGGSGQCSTQFCANSNAGPIKQLMRVLMPTVLAKHLRTRLKECGRQQLMHHIRISMTLNATLSLTLLLRLTRQLSQGSLKSCQQELHAGSNSNLDCQTVCRHTCTVYNDPV